VTENIKDDFSGTPQTIITSVVMYQWLTEGTSYPVMTIYESQITNTVTPDNFIIDMTDISSRFLLDSYI